MQENVIRLDVAMNDILSMRVVERTGDLTCNAHGIDNWQLSFTFQSRAQRFACHQRHDVVQQSVGVARVEQRQDVRMLQPSGGADLAQEPLSTECGTEIWMQHLDGDVAVVLEVVCEVHGGHATRAEFALEAIAVRECAGEPFERVIATGHGYPQRPRSDGG